jgi:hypothetical protein
MFDNNNNNNNNNNNKMSHHKVVNKRFEDIYELCMKYKWDLKENTEKVLRFTNPTSDTDEFIVNVDSDEKIEVSVPLWNSNITFSKMFNNYHSANDFAYDKIIYFENNRKNMM